MDPASPARRSPPRPSRRLYDRYDYYVVHLAQSVSPDQVADRFGMQNDGPLPSLSDHFLLRARKTHHDVLKRELQEHRRRKRDLAGPDVLDGVLLARKQVPRMRLEKRFIPPPPDSALDLRASSPSADAATVERQNLLMDKLNIRDPIFKEQWHLINTLQPGHDINVTGLWLEGTTGFNATVAIIDDGIDMHSDDLKQNYFAEGSWDFNDNQAVPEPKLSDDRHGTRCAGEVAAVRNDVCGIGAAYNARVAGIRILSKPISDADEADAMVFGNQENQIYSCSWGPRDDGRSMEAPGILIQRAILKGIQEGRGGLGSIYVFASGNGAASGDNCNFDGYTNSIYSITVGAVDRAGHHPYYSELCSAQLVVTYSSGGGDSIHTTDVGVNRCTSTHGGTSAAAPLAAGIFALVMQVRPDLTWRDMQYLAMDTAIPVQDKQESWKKTAIGKQYSHYFGYGKIDSYALVEKAKTWKKVMPQAWLFSPWVHVGTAIPEGEHGLVTHFEVTADAIRSANLARLEHVTVTMNLNHTRRGDVSVDLISPENVVSHIATARAHDNHRGGYDDWTFMTVVHWGESGIGNWSLVVHDTKQNEHQGMLVDWHLKLWGEAIDAAKAYPLPMPNATDDDDHDRIQSTITGPVATSTVIPLPEEPTSIAIPTDHPERPTKPGAKPTPTATSTPGVTPPIFTKPGPVWLYGALCLIIVFCVGLGAYLWVARRRRLRNQARDNYEFELIDEEELEALDGGEKDGLGGRRGRRTRGGELYDAFAGGSDDDDGDEGHGDAGLGAYKDQSAERLVGEDEAEQYVVGEESDDDGGADGGGEGRGGGGAGDDASLLGVRGRRG
ncbi:subtilase family protein [Hirsutella rhossiliensis]|uniref:Subtilase family domain-containing protein n=1 Tax=Hirsutella rhossiliensis TaxID=111463 RepID=A0A9P8MQ94_9HYPO|nr:subtilase family domain-containing protein [Hirsutella rhossiliensis]KAH0959184.1 subtilase family domain-containing protein [Hirsutella rhossiliensis]